MLKNTKNSLIKTMAVAYLSLLILAACPMAALASVTTLQNRSLSISTSAGGALATHTFSFNFPISEDVGSLLFQYCTDPIDEITCVTPTGMNASGATLVSQTGETGFSLTSATQNELVLSRPVATVGNQINTYQFDGVVNPSDIGPFFVRISAYTTTDASGAYESFSSVAGSIAVGININTEVPPILYFCSAVSIPTDCSDATGDFIEFGDLSSKATSAGTSQFMVGTNAPNGYSVTANGFTMTSGTDQINATSPLSTSATGTSQFGMNLAANLSPLVGASPVGGSGAALPNYSQANRFTYGNGDTVAQSTGPTELQLYTVSYIVNVNSTQPAGVYNTTITYVCTAGF
jgi:hypothetical protein